MNACQTLSYLPVAICAVHDSPIDALAAMHVPFDEAMDLVAAWWRGNEATCIVALVDGGGGLSLRSASRMVVGWPVMLSSAIFARRARKPSGGWINGSNGGVGVRSG